jgi:glycosyltransferase involved in cell wall biosynthesis
MTEGALTKRNSMPKVSIVVPAFNAADYVAGAIDSLLAQDYANLEIVAVDDGSFDGTGEVLRRYESEIRVHRQANCGQSAAMAAGWNMTDGAFIGYLSADDRLKSHAVRRCAEELEARPHVIVVYPDFEVIDKHSRSQRTIMPPDFSRRALYGKLHCLPGPGALFRRTAYKKVGAWRQELRQIPDLDFYLRMALEGDFYHVPEVLAEFRIHPQSTTYRAVPFEYGEEPLRVVDCLFERADLPAEIRRWERQARAHADLLSAVIHGRSGRTSIAVRRLASALVRSPKAWSHKALGHALTIARSAVIKGVS